KSYDPFGKPRKGNLESVEPPTLRDVAYQSGFISEPDDLKLETRRGFTDHEHLDDAQLIHMNGRVYDYNAGRFLSVDPFIQSPGNSQSMNPYSYIMNNPLAGTDPSGYKANCGGVYDINCVDPTEQYYAGLKAFVSSEKHNGSACKVGTCGGQAAMKATINILNVEDIKTSLSEKEARKLGERIVKLISTGGTRKVISLNEAGNSQNNQGNNEAGFWEKAGNWLGGKGYVSDLQVQKDMEARWGSPGGCSSDCIDKEYIEQYQEYAEMALGGASFGPIVVSSGQRSIAAFRISRGGKTEPFQYFGGDGHTYLLGEISEKGIVSFDIQAGKSIRGGDLFKVMMKHFGGNVKGVEGYWVGGTNLDRVNKLTSQGVSLKDAVHKTWTANQASKYGFKSGKVVSSYGEHGNYQMVNVVFQ
ncbi:RHS repeat domain-containing protein, partial [Aliikangiella coralliicola]